MKAHYKNNLMVIYVATNRLAVITGCCRAVKDSVIRLNAPPPAHNRGVGLSHQRRPTLVTRTIIEIEPISRSRDRRFIIRALAWVTSDPICCNDVIEWIFLWWSRDFFRLAFRVPTPPRLDPRPRTPSRCIRWELLEKLLWNCIPDSVS